MDLLHTHYMSKLGRYVTPPILCFIMCWGIISIVVFIERRRIKGGKEVIFYGNHYYNLGDCDVFFVNIPQMKQRFGTYFSNVFKIISSVIYSTSSIIYNFVDLRLKMLLEQVPEYC